MDHSTKYDQIYAAFQAQINAFQFDKQVVDVFPDMIARSVPGYTLMLPLIGLLAARYAQPNSRCYDMGCSLGAVLLTMRHRITQPGCQLIGIDNSAAMIAECRQILAQDTAVLPVQLQEADVRQVSVTDASVVVFNFTLQFVPPADRQPLLSRIHQGMRPGGALILSEKVQFADAQQNGRFVEIHHDFKRANGYSDLEISQKRSALENVLVPETIETHRTRLKSAGFQTAEVWFQAYNFMSILALA